MSCPVNDLEIDRRTLDLIDTDQNGQIRVPEILEAVRWVTSLLNDPGCLLHSNDSFPLSAINERTEEGATLLNSAREILKNLGRAGEDFLTVADTSDLQKIFSDSRFNGDGIITEDSATEEPEKKLIADIISVMGSETDRGGKPGISDAMLDNFLLQCGVYAEWYAQKETATKTILPLDENTPEAYAAWDAVRAKVDDYFLRVRLAEYEPQTAPVLNLQLAAVESITAQNLGLHGDEIAAYPIARIEPDGKLHLSKSLNPAWEARINSFRELVALRLLPGTTEISAREWEQISAVCRGYGDWILAKQGAVVEPLGIDSIRAILSGNQPQKLKDLIEQDLSLATEAGNMILVDKLVRYHCDLFTLLKNFVTFNDFYTPGHKAIFQAGTLYIEQRSCDLCIRVRDMTKHSSLASFSGMFLVYCECKSRATAEKMTIVAALTNGDIDNLVVGRNALFYDRAGQDWDATIIKIIDNPISIRQAFFSPYRKLSRFIETQINKAASSQDEKVSGNLSKGVETMPAKVEETKTKKEAAPPFDVGKFVGIFAAIGLALGAIGSALASVIAGFMKLEWWKIPFALMGLLLLISGPSMIMAYLKLRKRNLAPILDANGWAINAMVAVNIQFGNMLTHLAELPSGARINFNDPFTKKKRPVLPIIFIVCVLAGAVLFLLCKNKVIHIRF